jgi:putative hydrolase
LSQGSPFGSGGPLQDLLRNLARLLTSQGPVNWEIARQLAIWTATEGRPEANPDPLARMKLEELLRVADMHIAEATGLQTSRRGWLGLRAVPRSEWAARTLDLWNPVLVALASSLSPGLGGVSARGGLETGAGGPFGAGAADAGAADAGAGADPMSQLLGNLPQVLGPLVLGAQAGTMVGHLAARAMGQYDLPMPAPTDDELMAVPETIDSFAREWSLAPDDVRMWVCLRDVAHHAVLSRPHVREALERHLMAYVSAFDFDEHALGERLGNLDPTDLASFQETLGDPEVLLGAMQNDAQRKLLVPFHAFLAALSGYTDFVVDKVGHRLVGSYAAVTEALRRRRLEDGPGQRVLGKLLGVELDRTIVERGHAFVNGILERAGEQGISRLWEKPGGLPTPAEVDAPGLWLARIELTGE